MLFSRRRRRANYVSLFGGKTLNNWDGDPKFWTVQDGAITGITTKETPTKGNTFIIYTGKENFTNFGVACRFQDHGRNSGIQYRSFRNPVITTVGALVAIRLTLRNWGQILRNLLRRSFPWNLSLRGQKTVLTTKNGKLQKKAETFGDTKEIGKAIKKKEWNSYRIVADGFNFTHYINNVKTTEVMINDEKNRP